VTFQTKYGEVFSVDRVVEEYEVAPQFVYSLFMFLNNGTPPGSFLEAVIRNDLFAAIDRGDTMAVGSLPGLVRFLRCRASSYLP
jgi:hypothetical protein